MAYTDVPQHMSSRATCRAGQIHLYASPPRQQPWCLQQSVPHLLAVIAAGLASRALHTSGSTEVLCRCICFSVAGELFMPTIGALILSRNTILCSTLQNFCMSSASRNTVLCSRCKCLGALSALPDLSCPPLEHEVVGEVHLHRWQYISKIRLP